MGLDILTERIGTVGQLIEAVEYLEGTPEIIRNAPTGTPEDDKCKALGIHYWYRLNDVVLRSPGVADVKMMCEARGGWTCTELRRQRGLVGDSRGLSAATLDAMPVVEFATLLAAVRPARVAHQAHQENIFSSSLVDDDNELTVAIAHLDAKRKRGVADRDILRQLTNEEKGNCPNAIKLQSRIRKARGDGKTQLPPRTKRTKRTGR